MAMDFLIGEMKIDKSRLYATYFEGNASSGLNADDETKEIWKKQ